MNHNQIDRAKNQQQTDKMIENKLGSSSLMTKGFCLVSGNCNWASN